MELKGNLTVETLIDILKKENKQSIVSFEIKTNYGTESIDDELVSLTQEEFESMLEEVRYVAENYN